MSHNTYTNPDISRYMYLNGGGDERRVRGKKGSAGVHIFKTTQVGGGECRETRTKTTPKIYFL